ncbi:MAG: ribbon-helix-helix protein, CopG family [Halobacteriales archaeon]
MGRRLSLVCDDEVIERVDALAREYGLPRQEVLRQVIETGLEEIETERAPDRA